MAAAYEYGILRGYDDGTFRPGNAISRQEAMVMVARAMKIAGLDTQLAAADVQVRLSQFADATDFASWSQNAAALVAQVQVMVGHDGLAKPTANITRAETATIIMRMLQTAGLI